MKREHPHSEELRAEAPPAFVTVSVGEYLHLLNSATMPERLMVRDYEAADIVGIGRSKFLQKVSEGGAPLPVRIGRRSLWPVQWLRSWCAGGCKDRFAWETERLFSKREG